MSRSRNRRTTLADRDALVSLIASLCVGGILLIALAWGLPT